MIGEEHIEMKCQKSPERPQKSNKVGMWLIIECLTFESIFKFCYDQPLTNCQPVS